MTTYYLDTSIAVRVLLRESRSLAWFDRVVQERDDELVSSRLLQTELTRVLRRERMPVADRELVLAHLDIAPVTESILTSAEAIIPHVKSLDAIHLATALALGSATIVVTHDGAAQRVAEELGLRTFDPMA